MAHTPGPDRAPGCSGRGPDEASGAAVSGRKADRVGPLWPAQVPGEGTPPSQPCCTNVPRVLRDVASSCCRLCLQGSPSSVLPLPAARGPR